MLLTTLCCHYMSLALVFQGRTVVDNLLSSDDIHYMLGALKTLGLHVEDDNRNQRAIVEGCGGQFPVGKKSEEEIQLFLGNAGTAMRPLTAAVTVAGGHSRSSNRSFFVTFVFVFFAFFFSLLFSQCCFFLFFCFGDVSFEAI